MVETDSSRADLKTRFSIQMPDPRLSAQDEQAIIQFLHWNDASAASPTPSP